MTGIFFFNNVNRKEEKLQIIAALFVLSLRQKDFCQHTSGTSTAVGLYGFQI